MSDVDYTRGAPQKSFIVSFTLTASLMPDLLIHPGLLESSEKAFLHASNEGKLELMRGGCCAWKTAQANERAQYCELGSVGGVVLIKCHVEGCRWENRESQSPQGSGRR